MREIKFRAWLKKPQKMKEIHTLFHMELATGFVLIDGKVAYCKTRDRGQNLAVLDYPDCELMQYTGLKDKDGKEIYEGDVISIFDDKEPQMFVEWNEKWHSFGTQHIGQDDSFLGLPEQNHASRSWEIIGNIYENPELLTPSK